MVEWYGSAMCVFVVGTKGNTLCGRESLKACLQF